MTRRDLAIIESKATNETWASNCDELPVGNQRSPLNRNNRKVRNLVRLAIFLLLVGIITLGLLVANIVRSSNNEEEYDESLDESKLGLTYAASGGKSEDETNSTPSSTNTTTTTPTPSDFPKAMTFESSSNSPTGIPTVKHSIFPTAVGSKEPTSNLSSKPTDNPTEKLTMPPSSSLSSAPSYRSSDSPTIAPSNKPIVGPTRYPSSAPIAIPSQDPSYKPTTVPTISPSSTPTTSPTASPTMERISNDSSSAPTLSPTTSSPTWSPTDSPETLSTFVPSESATSTTTIASALTEDNEASMTFVPNPVPPNPPPWYFNYDINDNEYGPNAWGNVDVSNHFLKEFTAEGWGPLQGHLEAKMPLLNRCGGRERRQSPKNVFDQDICESHHEIRSFCGSRSISSHRYERLILPHKLSLVMNRRRCLDIADPTCELGRPPIADYPKYSSALTPYSDLLNLDIKVPGEHTLEGESFDAEIQMLHTHLDPDPTRVSSIAIPIRATADGFNAEFQQLLVQFHATYEEHSEQCQRRRKIQQQRKQLRRRTTSLNQILTSSASFAEKEEEKEEEDIMDNKRNREVYHNSSFFQEQQELLRELRDSHVPQEDKFNPYSPAFMPGIHFYRYDGSITEPPCMDITWWVMMDPMIISFAQLQQIKVLLFTHHNENCEMTSVHNEEQSVARPIYPLGEDRTMQKCDTFISDEAKGRGDGNICRPL